jgi:hypothetical protein
MTETYEDYERVSERKQYGSIVGGGGGVETNPAEFLHQGQTQCLILC